MRRTLVTLAALALSLGLAGTSFAQSDGSHQARMPRVHHRQVVQERRIREGERLGQITPREARQLERGQMRIERMKERAQADGRVTARERARIQRAQNVQNAKIWRARHNHRHQARAY